MLQFVQYGLAWSAALFVALALIKALAPLARHVRLVDVPNERKHHRDDIPLIGGSAVYITSTALLLALCIIVEEILHLPIPALLPGFAAGGLLVFVGLLDDLHELSIRWRVIMTAVAALIFTFGTGFNQIELGDLFGQGAVSLQGWQATAFMTICIFGMVNAFDMLDGLDGILGLNLIGSVVLFYTLMGRTPPFELMVVMGALSGYLWSNLSLTRHVPKVFLGDSGSMLLGFVVAVFLLAAATTHFGNSQQIPPVTALYMVGLPLIDMVTVTLRRMFTGGSPFEPGRDHFHHLVLDMVSDAVPADTKPRIAIFVVTVMGMVYPAIGTLMLKNAVATPVQFRIIVGLGIVHLAITSIYWFRHPKLS